MVIVNALQCRPKSRTRRHNFPIEIDGLYPAHMQVGVPAQPPNGVDDVLNFDTAGNHFGQHRLKDEVVFAVDESDLDFAPAPEYLFQIHCGVDAAEASAENDDL